MKNRIATLTVSTIFLLAGCGQQISEYVSSGTSVDGGSGGSTPNTSSSPTVGRSVSSGAQISEGTQVKSQHAIGTYFKILKGSQIDSKLTLNRQRQN